MFLLALLPFLFALVHCTSTKQGFYIDHEEYLLGVPLYQNYHPVHLGKVSDAEIHTLYKQIIRACKLSEPMFKRFFPVSKLTLFKTWAEKTQLGHLFVDAKNLGERFMPGEILASMFVFSESNGAEQEMSMELIRAPGHGFVVKVSEEWQDGKVVPKGTATLAFLAFNRNYSNAFDVEGAMLPVLHGYDGVLHVDLNQDRRFMCLSSSLPAEKARVLVEHDRRFKRAIFELFHASCNHFGSDIFFAKLFPKSYLETASFIDCNVESVLVPARGTFFAPFQLVGIAKLFKENETGDDSKSSIKLISSRHSCLVLAFDSQKRGVLGKGFCRIFCCIFIQSQSWKVTTLRPSIISIHLACACLRRLRLHPNHRRQVMSRSREPWSIFKN